MPFAVKRNATLGQVKKKSKDVTGKGIVMNPPRMLWKLGDRKKGLLNLAYFSLHYGFFHCMCILLPPDLSVVL